MRTEVIFEMDWNFVNLFKLVSHLLHCCDTFKIQLIVASLGSLHRRYLRIGVVADGASSTVHGEGAPWFISGREAAVGKYAAPILTVSDLGRRLPSTITLRESAT